MKRMAWLAPLLLAATFHACSQSTTPEQQVIDDATAALGGRDRIQAVKTLVIRAKAPATRWDRTS